VFEFIINESQFPALQRYHVTGIDRARRMAEMLNSTDMGDMQKMPQEVAEKIRLFRISTQVKGPIQHNYAIG